ncbi:MAG: class I SAM-dependent methyltransferase [Acidimicrobiia bacterium]
MEAGEVSRRIYQQLTADGGSRLAVRTWTGDQWGPADAEATLVLRHPGAFRALLVPPNDLTAGEAYLYDDVDVEGDIVALLESVAGLESVRRRPLEYARLMRLARGLPDDLRRASAERPMVEGRVRSRRRNRQAVTYHYDTGNEFFALFLDPSMVYSCADFLTPTESLETAQRRKLDLICRKLQLTPGERLLDVGCGWGGLVIHAASHFGVEATGVTLSGPQADLAQSRVKELELEDRVTIVEADYRDVAGSFDAIASVGMFEHVGRATLSTYFKNLKRKLTPGGRLLNHGIVTRDRSRRRRKTSFISTYVFPDSELIPVEETIGVAERAGFELRDVESLRASYALTLRHWVANLEANASQAIDLVGERTFRVWRLYMAGSALAFERAHIGVYQLLLTDPGRDWTFGRRHLLAADDR